MSISEWHYVKGGTSAGPFSQPEMERLIAQGEIGPNVLVWNDTMPQWEPALHHFDGFRSQGSRTTGGYQRHGHYNALYEGAPARGFFEAGLVCLRKYATFRGRASRSEYWFFVLFSMLLGAIAGALDTVIALSTGTSGFVGAIVTIGLILPSIAVSVRRLHDIDKSGWWVGVVFLVYLGMIGTGVAMYLDNAGSTEAILSAMFVFVLIGFALMIYSLVLMVFYCLRGTPGPNRYG